MSKTAGTITPLALSELLSFVETHSGQKALHCYQCGKCTAGCPSAYAMDLSPRQIMRAIQLGLKEEVLQSSTIWLCIFCQTCSARCPQEIDIPSVMESLRMLALTEKSKPAEKNVQRFHNIFLDLIRRGGRVHELELGARYNLSSGHPFANMALLPGMLRKKKMPILPPKVKGGIKKKIRKLFAEVGERGKPL